MYWLWISNEMIWRILSVGQSLNSYFPGCYHLDFFIQRWTIVAFWPVLFIHLGVNFLQTVSQRRTFLFWVRWDLEAAIFPANWIVGCGSQVCLSDPQSMKLFFLQQHFSIVPARCVLHCSGYLVYSLALRGLLQIQEVEEKLLLLQWRVAMWHSWSRCEVPQNTLGLRAVTGMREAEFQISNKTYGSSLLASLLKLLSCGVLIEHSHFWTVPEIVLLNLNWKKNLNPPV